MPQFSIFCFLSKYFFFSILVCPRLQQDVLKKSRENTCDFIKNLTQLCFIFSRCKFDTKEITVSPSSSFASNPSVKCRAGGALACPLPKKEFGRDRRKTTINYQVPPPNFQTFCRHWNAFTLYCFLPYRKLLLVDKFQSELRWNKKKLCFVLFFI